MRISPRQAPGHSLFALRARSRSRSCPSCPSSCARAALAPFPHCLVAPSRSRARARCQCGARATRVGTRQPRLSRDSTLPRVCLGVPPYVSTCSRHSRQSSLLTRCVPRHSSTWRTATSALRVQQPSAPATQPQRKGDSGRAWTRRFECAEAAAKPSVGQEGVAKGALEVFTKFYPRSTLPHLSLAPLANRRRGSLSRARRALGPHTHQPSSAGRAPPTTLLLNTPPHHKLLPSC